MADRDGAIQAILLADATVAARVAHRVWFSVLPQERAGVGWMPSVVVQGQDAEDEYTMGGPIGLARGQVQVDGWADDRAGCEALRDGVRDALGGLQWHRGGGAGYSSRHAEPAAGVGSGGEALAVGPILRRVGVSA